MEIIRYALYLMDIGCRQADGIKGNATGEVCVIYDRRGMTMKNFDSRLFVTMKKLVDVVQIMYAERLGKIYILGANWFYFSLLKIISPMLSEKTKKKIVLIDSNEELLNYFKVGELEGERLNGKVWKVFLLSDKWI